MLNFDFLEKSGLGLVSPPHFVYDFSRKMFLVLCSSLANQISLSAFNSWDIEQISVIWLVERSAIKLLILIRY